MDNKNSVLTIAYVSKLCSPSSFSRFFRESNTHPVQQAQKYNRLMAEGLAAHENVRVVAIGTIPASRKISKKIFFSPSSSIEGGVNYQEPGVVNIPILLQLSAFLGTFARIWRVCRNSRDCVVVCDILSMSTTASALLAAKLSRVKTVGVVTDLPGYFASKTNRALETFSRFLLSRFSSYLFLTAQMNDVINKKNRPYVVIEGQVDIRMAGRENNLLEKYPGRVCMYAGSIKRIYGIDMLVEAFIEADMSDAVLQIYGAGDFEEDLKEICRSHKNIRFGGTAPNEQIVGEQLKAALLVNPRPTAPEYTKYSFPSKNMEYIASGTPLLTTMLPGMPDEYLPYVYIFERETIGGYTDAIRDILSMPAESLHEKGMKAKKFAIEQKNNVVQAGKLLRMILDEVMRS